MFLTQKGNALLLQVKVVPNSSRTKVAGLLGGALKLKVAQPPEGGKANEAVLALVAEVLAIVRSQVAVVAGHSAARKTVQITGLTEAVARERLARAVSG